MKKNNLGDLKNKIQTLANYIEIDMSLLKNLSELEAEKEFLISILNLCTLYNKNNKILIPHHIKFGRNNSLLISTRRTTSLAEIFFKHNAPIILFLSKSLTLAIKKNFKEISSLEEKLCGQDILKKIINATLSHYKLYDINDKLIIPSVFLIKNSIEPVEFNPIFKSPLSLAIIYAKHIGDVEIDRGLLLIRDLSILKVPLKLASRAITPYTFGNCTQGCKFCYINSRLSPVIIKVLEEYDSLSGYGLPQPRFAFMDWEPTNHKDFFKILELVAGRETDKQIPIITHGGNLNNKFLSKIARNPLLKDLVLFQVSLNSASSEVRSKIMRGATEKQNQVAINSIRIMHNLGIKYDISIVASISNKEPNKWLPIDDLKETIKYLNNYPPYSYVRIALPTGTGGHNPEMILSSDELRSLDRHIRSLRKLTEIPLIITVGMLSRRSLLSEIEGIMPKSDAQKSGLKTGDIIVSINNKFPRSRTEATSLLQKYWDHKIPARCKIRRNGENLEITLKRSVRKKLRIAGEKTIGFFGIIMYDDIDFEILEKIKRQTFLHNLKKPLLITSNASFPIFKKAISRLRNEEKIPGLKVISSSNKFFNTPTNNQNVEGNVNIAGLLTFSDIEETLKLIKPKQYDCIIISAHMLTGSEDLAGININDFERSIGKPVFAIRANTGSI